MDYLHKHFPVILHVATPIALTDELKQKLNTFFPIFRDRYKEFIKRAGKDESKYRLFEPHHLAIVLFENKIIFGLSNDNANNFMTGLYCFKFPPQLQQTQLENILVKNFYHSNWRFYEFDHQTIESPEENLSEEILSEVEGSEWELIKREENVLDVRPKVFKNTSYEVKEGYCFVLMPFEEKLTEVYEDTIKNVIESMGMTCQRADDIFHNEAIMDVIWSQICQAELVICDLTHKNPNVFYELGIAHTLGKEVIILTQDEDDVPFDIRHIKYIQYETSKRGQEKLEQEVQATIDGLKENPDLSSHY